MLQSSQSLMFERVLTANLSRSSRPEVLYKKMFLKISQNTRGKHPWKTPVSVSFIIKSKVWRLQLLKNRLWHRYFPVNFAKFLRIPFFTEPTMAASVSFTFSLMTDRRYVLSRKAPIIYCSSSYCWKYFKCFTEGVACKSIM